MALRAVSIVTRDYVSLYIVSDSRYLCHGAMNPIQHHIGMFNPYLCSHRFVEGLGGETSEDDDQNDRGRECDQDVILGSPSRFG